MSHQHIPSFDIVAAPDGAEESVCMECGRRVHRPISPGAARNRNPWTLHTEPLIHSGAFMRRPDFPEEDMDALGRLYDRAEKDEQLALLGAIYNAYSHDSVLTFMERVVPPPATFC